MSAAFCLAIFGGAVIVALAVLYRRWLSAWWLSFTLWMAAREERARGRKALRQRMEHDE